MNQIIQLQIMKCHRFLKKMNLKKKIIFQIQLMFDCNWRNGWLRRIFQLYVSMITRSIFSKMRVILRFFYSSLSIQFFIHQVKFGRKNFLLNLSQNPSKRRLLLECQLMDWSQNMVLVVSTYCDLIRQFNSWQIKIIFLLFNHVINNVWRNYVIKQFIEYL